MPRKIQIDWEPVKSLYISGKTARELAVAFGITETVILKKASLDKWGSLRRQVKAVTPLPPMNRQPRNPKTTVANGNGILVESEQPILKNVVNDETQKIEDVAVQRAIILKNSNNFREKVITQANKALSVLEKATPSNVFETDRFADALTKVERIGARAYGYDREGQQPVINIGILGTGSEYDAV